MSLWNELKSPEVLIGLGLFALGSLVLWHRWGKKGKSTPWPIGIAMPF